MESKNITISVWQSEPFFKKTSYFNRLRTAELDIALCDIHIQTFNINMRYTALGQMAGEMVGVNCMNFLQN
jgi:hypothetical protein